MTMPLFTVIAEYKGGTYIHQLRAVSARTAMLKWPSEIDWVTHVKEDRS